MRQSKIPPAGSPSTSGPRDRRVAGRAQDKGVGDTYKLRRKLSEPTRCPSCGAVYRAGRWQWVEIPPADAYEETCQACRRIQDQYPAGIVTLRGSAVRDHEDEIRNLAHNTEQAEKKDHPLNRIMDIQKEAPDILVITTTDVHLPHRIGTALRRAFHGDLTMNFDEDAYFIRVDWTKES